MIEKPQMWRSLLTMLGLGSLFAGCHQPPDYSPIWTQLKEAGFCQHLSDSKVELVKQEVMTRGWSGIYSEAARYVHVDAEGLTECGVTSFLEDCRPFLEQVGVQMTVQDHWEETGYTVTLNGRIRTIWTVAEFERERNGNPGLTWGLSTIRAFGLVNEMLEAAGSNERLYAVRGGNDLAAIFLTPQLLELVHVSSGWKREEWPYLPKDDGTSWYGQPHD